MNHKDNSRAQKTDSILKDTFVDLLKLKSIDKITVTEIAEKANIHRGTFYTHYTDVYDLFDDIENNFIDEVKQIIRLYFDSNEPEPTKYYTKILEFFSSNPYVTKTILNKGKFDFFDSLIEWRYPKSFEKWQSRYSIGNEDNYNYYFISIVSTFNALLYSWVDNNFDKSPDEIANIAKDFLKRFGFKKQFKD